MSGIYKNPHTVAVRNKQNKFLMRKDVNRQFTKEHVWRPMSTGRGTQPHFYHEVKAKQNHSEILVHCY